MSAQTLSNSAQERVDSSKLVRAGALGGILGAVINTVVFLIANGALNIPLNISMGPDSPKMPMLFFMPAIATLVAALFATGLLALLGRFTQRPHTIFMVISVIFLLVSFAGPATLGLDMAGLITLVVMHIVAGVTIAGALATQTRA